MVMMLFKLKKNWEHKNKCKLKFEEVYQGLKTMISFEFKKFVSFSIMFYSALKSVFYRFVFHFLFMFGSISTLFHFYVNNFNFVPFSIFFHFTSNFAVSFFIVFLPVLLLSKKIHLTFCKRFFLHYHRNVTWKKLLKGNKVKFMSTCGVLWVKYLPSDVSLNDAPCAHVD
jgi:hypothetical protein